jgi:hypothetical protein
MGMQWTHSIHETSNIKHTEGACWLRLVANLLWYCRTAYQELLLIAIVRLISTNSKRRINQYALKKEKKKKKKKKKKKHMYKGNNKDKTYVSMSIERDTSEQGATTHQYPRAMSRYTQKLCVLYLRS